MDRVDPAPRLVPTVPAPPASPLSFWGYVRAIRTNALTIWTERAYQEPFEWRRLVGRSTLLVNAPDAIHRVLVDNPGNYRRSPASIRILRPVIGDGLLLAEGDAWRHQRRTIAPALAPRMMPLLAGHVVATAADHLDRLPVDAPVDLLAAVQMLALDIAGRSMVSLEMAAFGPRMRALIAEFATDLSRPHLFDMVLPAAVPTWRDLRRRRFSARWMRLIEEIVDARLSRPPQPEDAPRDLFDLLRAARDPETGAAFDRIALRDRVATMILAGHETTAVTLFWALLLLADAPHEQARVAAEAREIGSQATEARAVGSQATETRAGGSQAAEARAGGLDAAAVPRLVRTRAVVQETLRLFPPAFALVREAIGPDRLCDMDVPKGTVVMIAPWVLHRHARFWRDPAVFDPDRFMPDAPPPPRHAWLPFGTGPRVCVGAQFALTEATLALAMLLARYEVGRLDSDPVLPSGIVTLIPTRAPAFRLRRR